MSKPIPNGGMIYDPAQPVDNGGPLSALSSTSVVGTGGRLVGEGRPAQPFRTQEARAPVPQQTGVPSPAAAAAASRVPTQQQAQAPLAPVAPQQQQQQQYVARVPPSVPAECGKRPAVIAGENFDCDMLNSLGGEVKSRVITCGKLVSPAMVKARQITFSLNEMRHDILKHRIGNGKDRVGSLDRVIVVGLELISCKNELPFQVSFNMSGTKGRDYCWLTMERALLHMPPRYSEKNSNRKLHMHAPNVSISAFRRFGKIKSSQLSEGIRPMPNEDFSFVHTSSPVASVIRASHETLKPTLANVRVSENYMPVTNKLIENIQKFLNDKINSFPGTDYTKGAITFCRSTAHNFCETGDLEGCDNRAAGYELQQLCAVYVKFVFYYLILSNTAKARDMGTSVQSAAAEALFQNHPAAGAIRAPPAAPALTVGNGV